MNIIGYAYNFNLFAKNNVIKPDSESIFKLMPFIQDGFMPTTGEEINEDGTKGKVIRVEKETGKRNISVTFSSKFISTQITADEVISKEEASSILNSVFDRLSSLFKENLSLIHI